MGITAAVVVAAAGAAYSANQQHEAANTAGRHAATAARHQRELTQQRQDTVGRIRELYGVGDTTGAKANQSKLSGSIQDYYNSQLGANLRNTEDQFSNASRVGRQNLARVGQLGSGLDAETRSSNLADFIRSRQRAVSDAAASRSSLESNLTGQRLGLEGQVNSGSLSNPDYSGIAAQQQSLVDQAQGQIKPNAVANLFNVAGNTYFQGAQQGALGNQGLGAFFGGGSGGGGRNTSR